MNEKENLLEKLDIIQDDLKHWRILPEDAFYKLRNFAEEYLSGSEYLFDDFLTIEDAEELAKHELENGGLARLYFFLGEINPMSDHFLRIDGYGNLERAGSEDIENIIEELKTKIEQNYYLYI